LYPTVPEVKIFETEKKFYIVDSIVNDEYNITSAANVRTITAPTNNLSPTVSVFSLTQATYSSIGQTAIIERNSIVCSIEIITRYPPPILLFYNILEAIASTHIRKISRQKINTLKIISRTDVPFSFSPNIDT